MERATEDRASIERAAWATVARERAAAYTEAAR